MIIKEMHIEARSSMQNVGTNKRRRLEDAELDWLFNKVQQRFIQSKIKSRKDGSGGFEIDQLDADCIRTLLKEQDLRCNQVGFETQCELPGDYSYLISDDSKTTLLCGTTSTLNASTETSLLIPFPVSASGSAPYYATIVLVFGANNISLAGINTINQVVGYTGLPSKAEKYIIVDLLLWYIRNVLNVEVYWERYLGLYKPQTFIFPGLSAGSLTIDAGSTVAGTTTTNPFSVYADTSSAAWYSNRLTNSTKLTSMLNTAFYKPSNRDPISELRNNKLIIYSNESFTVSGVSVLYVKKPRRMSLLLNQDCELPEEFHQTICDLLVEYFKVMTTDPSWKDKLQDNMLRSPSTS